MESIADELEITRIEKIINRPKLEERKFVYLVNPVSGTDKKESLIKVIKNISTKQNLAFEFLETNALGNYDYLNDKIADEGITDIVIIGGDGTVNQVVGALYQNTEVRFGIIPFGSGNGLANAAGIPSKPKKAFELILQGTSKKTDAFFINGRFSCMLSGLGFDAVVAHEFAQKTHRGLLTYTQQSILNYFKAQPYQFEITVDDFSIFSSAFFISIANSNQFGNNFTIAPEAQLNDGLLDIVIVQKMNKAELPFAVLKQIRGNNKLQKLVEDISQKNVLYFQTPYIKIKNIMHAPLHIDGEPVETADELEAVIMKDCFTLIC